MILSLFLSIFPLRSSPTHTIQSHKPNSKAKTTTTFILFLGRTHKYTLIKWYGKKPSSRYTLTRVNIQRAITITTTTLWHGIDGIVVVIKRVEDLETHLTHGPSNGIECEKRKQISHAMTVFVSYGCLSSQEFLVHYFNVCVCFSVFLFRRILFFFSILRHIKGKIA